MDEIPIRRLRKATITLCLRRHLAHLTEPYGPAVREAVAAALDGPPLAHYGAGGPIEEPAAITLALADEHWAALEWRARVFGLSRAQVVRGILEARRG